MKQGISPAVAIIAILVVVVIVAAIGYFTVLKKKGVSGDSTEEHIEMDAARDQYEQSGAADNLSGEGGSKPPGAPQ